MIASFAAGAAQGPDFVFEMMGALDEATLRHFGFTGDIADLRATLNALRQLNNLNREARRRLLGAERSRQIRETVNGFVSSFLGGDHGFNAVVGKMWEQAGAPDLAIAAEAGLLTLSADAFEISADLGLTVDQYAETLKRLLGDPRSHLMFDDQIAGIVNAMLREEQAQLHPLTEKHAVRAATGIGLVERLPAFPEAPIEAILETRSELAVPLISYRKGIADLSAKLVSGPLDPALRAEVDDLWRDEVQPTLESLRRDLSATRIAKDAALSIVTDVKAITTGAAGAALVFGIGSIAELSALSGSAIAAAGGSVVHSAAKAVRDAAEGRRTARTHDLYYLLAANDRLR
ncbi:hypothetical protein J2W20_002390 [Sinomonas atrocyanea]|uniref:hypothetical protein n=1 Tax=Sinomonas atrocyanea TaxID=37927 RepID=UPI002785BCB0|nr:hypothetical protein [Sinomonas atrocyanea]MDQ0260486.1 hypothetical protein [Sinomonas atrocyanea]